MSERSAATLRGIKALAIAPLTAPVLYWIGALLVGIADSNRSLTLRESVSALSLILLGGAPVSYLAAFVAAGPAFAMLRRWGIGALPGVLVIGAVVGVATAVVMRPHLRGDLFSIILTPWEGGALGCAAAGVFCWLNARGGRTVSTAGTSSKGNTA